MKLIKPSYSIIEQSSGLEGVYKQIELVGRVSHKSEDKIKEDSSKEFVDRMIKLEHCYTESTEILTENGWIKFKDYNNEKVAVINKDCSFKGFESPKRVVKYSYKGNFYYYPSLGIEVTDGHSMFGVFRESKNNFYKNSSYSLFRCNDYYKDNNGRVKTLGERMFKTPKHCLKNKFLDPYGELIGFWLGDGCYNPEIKNKLVFHLKKQRKVEYLKQLCKELGYIFEKRKSNYYTVSNKDIGTLFNSTFYNNGKRISLQYFPSITIAYSIINGLINSDGSLGTNTKTISFTNTSKSIMDWLAMYAPICGYSVSNISISHYTTSNNPVYRALLLDTDYTLNNDSRNKDSKVIITNKVEKVYCVTVSTGLIMVRGINGVTTICGNCAVLEHGTVYLYINYHNPSFNKFINKYSYNSYSICIDTAIDAYITTNYRVLVENNWLDDLKYLCEPTESHEKRICVKFTLPISISREFCRHRTFSFMEMSTRYCNFSKDKFSNELTFILPNWINENPRDIDSNTYSDIIFREQLHSLEKTYLLLLKEGKKPQEAREILPLALKTELYMTGFISDWEHFFELRSNKYGKGGAHPQADELATPLYEEFIKRGYIN